MAIIVIVRKIPEKEKEFIRVGIAVYNMDDSYMSNYIEQLQVKLDSYDDFGKKILYEILDAEGDWRMEIITLPTSLRFLSMSGNLVLLG